MGIDFSKLTLPFTVTDMFTSAFGLMGLFGGFILIGLAIKFAPQMFSLFRKALGIGGGK